MYFNANMARFKESVIYFELYLVSDGKFLLEGEKLGQLR